MRLQELLNTSLDHVLSNLKVDAGLICLVDLEEEEHSIVCHRGFTEELERKIRKAKLADDPIAQEVVSTGRPVIIEDVFNDPRLVEFARREGFRSLMSAPLKSEGEVNGILAIASHQERHFNDNDQEFLEGIGGQLGMAIRNAVLYEKSQRQNRDLIALLAVSKVATSSFDLDELLGRTLDTIIDVTSADGAEVWLTEDDEDLTMRCHRGEHQESFMERTRFRKGEGIPGIVAETQEPLVTHDLPTRDIFLRKRVIDAGYHTFCGLPLRYKNRVIGVLTLAAFSESAISSQDEIRLLESIGEWMALAIENAHLYQQVQDLAVLQERERIAREMHDGMAQLLGYINTQTIAVKKFLSNQQFVEAHEELTKMEEIARDLYADVREGILGLRIAARRKEGLLAALREYTQSYMEMSGIQVDINASPDAERSQLTPSAEIQLIRIVQEALTNVRKHSRASTATVNFEMIGDGLRVTIADNGEGFEQKRLPSTGWPRFGLHTMRERAEAMDGTLAIDAAPGKGTTVEVLVPLLHREDDG